MLKKRIIVTLAVGFLTFHAFGLASAEHEGLPGTGDADGWVDVHGDMMHGDLDMQDHSLILNDAPLSGTQMGELWYGSAQICLVDMDDCPGPEGPPGPQGPEGPEGPQGEPGPQGASPFILVGDDAVYDQGNVGIGNGTPQAMLDVSGDVRISEVVLCQGCGEPVESQVVMIAVDEHEVVGELTSLAIGADGYPVIAYRDVTDEAVKVAHCGNIGCQDASFATIESGGLTGTGAISLAIGTDGNPVISYRNDQRDLKVAHCQDPGCSGVVRSTVDTADVSYSSIAIGTHGLPVVAYREFGGNVLKVALCDDPSCADADLKIVDNTANVGHHVSLVIGADGNPVISHKDVTNGNLKTAHCDDTACTAATLHTVDGGSDDVGAVSSIAIGPDGNPVISYRDSTNGDLKMTKCHDLACSSADLTVVDNTAEVGGDTSLAIGPDGNPIISHWDVTNDALKVAQCLDSACAEATLKTVDGSTSVGRWSSIAIGTDGSPVMSYYDAHNGDLKVTRIVTVDEPFGLKSSTGVVIYSDGDESTGVILPPGSGSWSSLSDRNSKEDLIPVDSRSILDALMGVPLYEWNYKAQPGDVRHVGPMAQDFQAAFGLGQDERRISTVDADGVSLAAVQGLNEIVQDQAQTIEDLEAQVDDLEDRLATLETLLDPLADR